MSMFERSRRTPLYLQSGNVYHFFTSSYVQTKLIMMLVFASVSNSLRLNKHEHIRALTTSMATYSGNAWNCWKRCSPIA